MLPPDRRRLGLSVGWIVCFDGNTAKLSMNMRAAWESAEGSLYLGKSVASNSCQHRLFSSLTKETLRSTAFNCCDKQWKPDLTSNTWALAHSSNIYTVARQFGAKQKQTLQTFYKIEVTHGNEEKNQPLMGCSCLACWEKHRLATGRQT